MLRDLSLISLQKTQTNKQNKTKQNDETKRNEKKRKKIKKKEKKRKEKKRKEKKRKEKKRKEKKRKEKKRKEKKRKEKRKEKTKTKRYIYKNKQTNKTIELHAYPPPPHTHKTEETGEVLFMSGILRILKHPLVLWTKIYIFLSNLHRNPTGYIFKNVSRGDSFFM